MLLIAITLVSISYAQTERPRIGPEAINSQDANRTPASPGARTATGTPSTSPSNPGQAAPGTAQRGPSFVIPATPANPPAARVNSALVTAPFESQSGIPQSAFFEFLFNNISVLNKVADNDDKAGNHESAAQWRTHDARGAGLNDTEGQILLEIALDCLRALKEQDAKFGASAEKFRAQLTPGAPVLIPPELVQMDENRKKIMSDHIERLRAALGDASFNKLDTYVHSSFHLEVIAPRPAPLSTTGEKRQENK
jgi:hypothetical protein